MYSRIKPVRTAYKGFDVILESMSRLLLLFIRVILSRFKHGVKRPIPCYPLAYSVSLQATHNNPYSICEGLKCHIPLFRMDPTQVAGCQLAKDKSNSSLQAIEAKRDSRID